MNERQMFKWMQNNIAPIVRKAIAESNESYFKVEDLCAIAYREVFPLLHRLVPTNMQFEVLCSLMKGDYSKREGETERSYHGFSFWQIDIGSNKDFIASGEWKNPLKACKKAIEILNGKKRFWDQEIEKNNIEPSIIKDHYERIIFASYNCGEGNVKKAILKSAVGNLAMDFESVIDMFTHEHNYSQKVLYYKNVYKSIM